MQQSRIHRASLNLFFAPPLFFGKTSGFAFGIRKLCAIFVSPSWCHQHIEQSPCLVRDSIAQGQI